jgi:hypothetical protein
MEEMETKVKMAKEALDSSTGSAWCKAMSAFLTYTDQLSYVKENIF